MSLRNVIVTDHAVDRFVERHAGAMSLIEARAWLEANAVGARYLRTKTCLGQEQWEIEVPRCVLVVKRDRRLGRPVCVTVLPEAEQFGGLDDETIEEVMVAAARTMPPHQRPNLDTEATMARRAKSLTPVKPPPKPLPPKVKGSAMTEATYLAQLELAKVKQHEKTARHLCKQESQIAKQKQIIRCALRYLLRRAATGDAEALEVTEAIQEVEPGMVTLAFMGGRGAALVAEEQSGRGGGGR